MDDNSRIEAGFVYHDYPMDLHEDINRINVAYTDVSGVLNYIREDDWAGHASKTTIGLRSTKAMPNNGVSESVRIPPGNTAGYPLGTKTRDYSYQGSGSVLHIGNDLELVPDVWLTTGLAAIYITRKVDVTYPSTGGQRQPERLGLRTAPGATL